MDSTAIAPSVAESPLFKLPAELRLRIYEYALYSHDDGLCTVTRASGIPEPALLLTCKAIRKECIAVFYTVNIFQTVSSTYNYAVHFMMEGKKTALAMAGMDVGRLVVRDYVSGRRQHLEALTLWLKLVHMGRLPIPHLQHWPHECMWSEALGFLESLFMIAKGMEAAPWADVEAIIVNIREGLIAIQERWGRF